MSNTVLMDWVAMAGYFLAAGLCLRAMNRSKTPARHAENTSAFWLFAFVVLLVFGAIKLVGVQTWLTFEGRSIAKIQGWYGERRILQGGFIAVTAVSGVVAAAVLTRRLRGAPGIHKIGAAGLVLLTCFVIIRAASLHYVDEFIDWDVAGVTLNRLFEITGILCVAVPAFLVPKQPLKRSSTSSSHRSAKDARRRAIKEG